MLFKHILCRFKEITYTIRKIYLEFHVNCKWFDLEKLQSSRIRILLIEGELTFSAYLMT